MRKWVFVFVLVLISCRGASADTVTLKSGKVIEGKIIRQNSVLIRILPEGMTSFQEFLVEQVESTTKDEPSAVGVPTIEAASQPVVIEETAFEPLGEMIIENTEVLQSSQGDAPVVEQQRIQPLKKVFRPTVKEDLFESFPVLNKDIEVFTNESIKELGFDQSSDSAQIDESDKPAAEIEAVEVKKTPFSFTNLVIGIVSVILVILLFLRFRNNKNVPAGQTENQVKQDTEQQNAPVTQPLSEESSDQSGVTYTEEEKFLDDDKQEK